MRILKTVNEFDSTDLPQIEILNNSVIMVDLEPLKGQENLREGQKVAGAEAGKDSLAEILKKLNPKL